MIPVITEEIARKAPEEVRESLISLIREINQRNNELERRVKNLESRVV